MQEQATAIDPRLLAAVAGVLEKAGPPAFEDEVSYIRYCRFVCRLWRRENDKEAPSPQFVEIMNSVCSEVDGTFRAPWGGGMVTNYNHPNVEQYLVVNSDHFLPFEKHRERVETFVCLSGRGVMVYRPRGEQALVAEPIVPNVAITFTPEQEHCCVSLSNLLLFERSTNPQGLGNDSVVIWSRSLDKGRGAGST